MTLPNSLRDVPAAHAAFVLALSLVVAVGCQKSGTAPAGPATAPARAAEVGTAEERTAEKATAEKATAENGTDDLYQDRILTNADVSERTLRELSLQRNTIFARHGNTFVKPWLDAHFRAQPWYRPKPKSKRTQPSARDIENAKLIGRFESQISAAELDKRAAAVRARIASGKADEHDPLEMRLLSARRGKWLGATSVAKGARTPLEDPTLLDAQLSQAPLDKMSRRDLRLLRNTIYARHGYVFTSDLLAQYFEATDWYTQRPNFAAKDLSAVDQRNLKLIRSVEDRRGGPLSDGKHADAIGWFGGA